MKQGAAMEPEKKQSSQRVSVTVTDEMLHEIDNRADRAGVSRSIFLARLLQLGLEAEQQKRDRFVQKIRQYRDCSDPSEAARLGNELGEMIFGR
jgi:metal-responsive CopG/Arc/MetJ family transcriptional regulator